MIRIEAIPALAKQIMASLDKTHKRRMTRSAHRQGRPPATAVEKISKMTRRHPMPRVPVVA